MDKYKVGNSNDLIMLIVDISTLGLAASRAILIDMNSNEPGVTIALSQNASGDIPLQSIGKASEIKEKRMSVLTKIDLLGDEDTRKKEADMISAKYILSNGFDGHIIFGTPNKIVNEDCTTVFLHKTIDLTK